MLIVAFRGQVPAQSRYQKAGFVVNGDEVIVLGNTGKCLFLQQPQRSVRAL